MTIEEILKNAGIELEAEALAKLKAEMPKAYMPLAEANKRIGEAKNATEALQKSFDDYKAEVEAAAKAAAGKDGEAAKALEDLQAKYADLEGKFNESQNAIKSRDARAALTDALKAAGANPAAVALLADSALARIEFGDDGKPSNVKDVAEAVKADNGGLFGEPIDTGKPAGKADADNDLKTAFDEGFGETKRN